MKMELEKNCLSLLTGRRLTSSPSAKAGPTLLTVLASSPWPSSLAMAQPTPARCLLPPCARGCVRHRQACRATWRAHAGDAGRVASRGPCKHAPHLFSSHRSSASPSTPHFPLPCYISPSSRTELCSRRPRHRSSAGEIGHRWSTVAHNRAHITPPRSPTPGARCRVTV